MKVYKFSNKKVNEKLNVLTLYNESIGRTGPRTGTNDICNDTGLCNVVHNIYVCPLF